MSNVEKRVIDYEVNIGKRVWTLFIRSVQRYVGIIHD